MDWKQGKSSKIRPILATQETLTDFNQSKKKQIQIQNQNGRLKKLSFSKPPILNIFFQKFQGLFLGLEGLINAKGIDVAQPIWS